MAKTTTYSGEEFIKALSEDKFSTPVELEGIAKPAGADGKAFMFSTGTDCGTWIQIPLDIVQNIELIRVISCKDHTHPLVRLQLKEPPKENPVGSLFAGLLRQMGAASAPISSRGRPGADRLGAPRGNDAGRR